MQIERDEMSDEEKRRAHRAHMDYWANELRKQQAQAEVDRLRFPWTDPHFINILKRMYRNYIKRR